MSLSGLSGESPEKQVQALMLCFSRETLTIVNNLGLTTEEFKSVASIISAIKNYAAEHINESVERRNFRHRTQQIGESFDDYLVSLRELVKTCNFCNDACIQKSSLALPDRFFPFLFCVGGKKRSGNAEEKPRT